MQAIGEPARPALSVGDPLVRANCLRGVSRWTALTQSGPRERHQALGVGDDVPHHQAERHRGRVGGERVHEGLVEPTRRAEERDGVDEVRPHPLQTGTQVVQPGSVLRRVGGRHVVDEGGERLHPRHGAGQR